ncbi:MAG: metallophosphoesterase family protein [Deltaproteobacteria bacterium]|nr:metallophosphoesterase family protein [Deltaproteobacteria bacterium]
MKIGVLSDTHLHAVTEEFKGLCEEHFSGVDLLFHAGDFVSADIVAFLEGWGFHGVHGNMDPLEIKAMLPAKKRIDLHGYRIGLIHGWGSPQGLEERVLGELPDVDVVVYGHSHRATNVLKEGVLLFNPGTASGFLHSGRHSIGILTLEDRIRGEIIPLD